MNRAKKSLLLAIAIFVFMPLITVKSMSARTRVSYPASPKLMDEALPIDDDARWDDGFGFSTVNQFPFVWVKAIAINSSGLYVGGYTLGGNSMAVNGIVRWDGSRWSAQGGGVSGQGHSLSANAVAIKGDEIYVGGNFQIAGFTPANHIARFDGHIWHSLGSGIDSCASRAPYVLTMAARGNDLYVGGQFNSAGGVQANNIARWDGENWHALGSGAPGPVYKIAFNGDDIYVGGAFTSIDGVKANGIARFDGAEWHALGSGVSGRVQAIAFRNNEVYVGGFFNTAGGKTIYNFARWVGPAIVTPPPTPPPPVILPVITGISTSRKKLIVAGERFEQGSVILLNGERQKTKNDEQNPQTLLIAKKSGKKARPGDRLQAQNPDGKLSPEFIITQ